MGLTRQWLLALLVSAALLAQLGWAQTGAAASEPEIKSAMLFHFAKFVEWMGPKGDARAPVVIGVAGDDGVREAMEELLKERGAGRPIQVRRIEAAGEAEACHILYLGKGVKKRTGDFLAAAKRGVVTVGDGEAFTKAGGVIGFIVVDNKLRFEVSLAGAGQAGVTISSRLLRLATGVKP